MTRELLPNHLHSVAVPIATVTVIIALAALAQSPPGQPVGKLNTISAIQDATMSFSSAAEQHLLPQSDSPVAAVNRSREERQAAGPAGKNPRLFPHRLSYYPGGTGTCGVAVADLNGDQSPDVVVSNCNSGTIGVLLGNGHGWFAPPVIYGSHGFGPASVAIGDVNGDGIPDIVAPDYHVGDDCGLGVLLGSGDGSFQPMLIPGVCGAWSVVLADMNGDGKLDVAVAGYRNVAVLLGNGDGTFQPVVNNGWGAGDGTSWGRNLAVADVNGDGKLDLVVATGTANYPNGNGTFAVLQGNGDGTFQPAVDHDSGGWYAKSLAVGDVNGDGRSDIVVTNSCVTYYCGVVDVLLGNGDGTFRAPVSYDPGGRMPLSVSVADVNGDGNRDLVIANLYGCNSCKEAAVGVLLGNGDGTFQPVATYSFRGPSWTAVVADVNGDGKPDVVVTTLTKVNVLLTQTGVATKTVVTSSGSPAFLGQPVIFTATVTPSQGTISDGELVAFYDGTRMLGTVGLASGTAAYTTSLLSAKAHRIKATYVGDATFRLGSGSVQQVVLMYPTATILASNPNPSNYGQPVTFTATVSSAGPTPTGKVKFMDGTTTLGTATLSGGVAMINKSKLAVGTHPITAHYLGDVASDKSTSSVVNQVVR